MSRPRMSLFRRSLVRTALFLISRESMEPVATAYDTPPRDTNRASREMTVAGVGVSLARNFKTGSYVSGSVPEHRRRSDGALRIRLDRQRQPHHEAGAAAHGLGELHLSAVRLGHGAHDREAETAAAAGGGVAGPAGEALE